MVKDLTQGKVTKVLILFTLPLLGSVVFQQLYNMADTVIAGKCIGESALAAVGASFPITMLFMAVALGCNLGCSVIVSRLFGEKQYRRVRESVSTILIAVAVLGAILTLIGELTAPQLMRMVKTPEDIFADAMQYLYIYVGGFLFVLIYNVCTGIFSALGDSRTPLYFLIASSLGNIVLDLVFVLVFHMGVPGLAWATFVAQGIAAVACMVTLLIRVRNLLRAHSAEDNSQERVKLFSGMLFWQMCIVAIPSILQQSFVSVGNLLIQGIVNSYGTSVVAGYIAAVKLNTFVITTATTTAGALSSFTAQNLGARALMRVKHGVRVGCVMVAVLCIPFTLIFAFAGKAALSLFMDGGGEVAMQTGLRFLRIVSPFYLIIGLKLIYDSVLRGSENMGAFMVATFADLAARVILCYLLNAKIGIDGVWWSWPIGWTLAAIISACFYFSGMWYKNKRIRARLAQGGTEDTQPQSDVSSESVQAE